ncbi:methyltransferase domain-containing protein [Kitasatospora camelliae]|uniref:Methyltransferase domain-containing protein n=1 Tax=Kitasatospora camelliae TaxID=3156397 RepID=A0AAU8K3Q8_9ACTN
MTSPYLFDPAWADEYARLTALEQVYDGPTGDLFRLLGVAEGWDCLEVGCGAGSTARQLAGLVGPSGTVLATDLDTRFAEGHGLPNLRLRRHDLLADPLPEAAFDLAHARAVVEHLPRREEALRRMAAAVRPGGWVLVEDFDIEGPMAEAVARYWPAGHTVLAGRLYRALEAAFGGAGVDTGFGRRLPEALERVGLTAVGGRIHAPLLSGGSPFIPLTLRRLRPRLLATGLLDAPELDAAVALIERQDVRYAPNFMVGAWGRRPTP